MTSFFAVHLVLTVASLALGTIVGILGIRALRARSKPEDQPVRSSASGSI